VASIAEKLASKIGADLERGGGSEFASMVRELSKQYRGPASEGPFAHVASARRAAADLDHGPADLPPEPPSSGQADQPPAAERPTSAPTSGSAAVERSLAQRASEPQPPRLVMVELLRLLSILGLLVAAVACGWMLVTTSQLSDLDSAPDIDSLEQARSVALQALAGGYALHAAWLLSAAWYARRVDASIRVWPYAVLVVLNGPTAIAAVAFEPGAAGTLSLVALLAATAAVIIGFRLMLRMNELFGLSPLTTNGLILDLAVAVLFLLVSGLGSEIGLDAVTARAQLAFGATLVGIAVIVGGVLAALVMSAFEDALRSSTELARITRVGRARSRDTHESSRRPSRSRRRD